MHVASRPKAGDGDEGERRRERMSEVEKEKDQVGKCERDRERA